MGLRTYARINTVSKKRRQFEALAKVQRERILERRNGRCQVVYTSDTFGQLAVVRCDNRAADVHHVQKRSQGGTGHPDNLIALCRHCHDRTDWPYVRGRLVITPLGQERFACAILYAASKFTVGRAGQAGGTR